MKITDMILSAIIKKGILYEARNCDLDFEIPMDTGKGTTEVIKINFKAEHMTLSIDKDS